MIFYHEDGAFRILTRTGHEKVTHGHDYHGMSYWYSLTGRKASGLLSYSEALSVLEPQTPLQHLRDVMERRIDRAFAKYFLGRTAHC